MWKTTSGFPRAMQVWCTALGLLAALAAPTVATASTTVVNKYKFEKNYRLTNPADPTGVFLNQDVEPSIKIDTDDAVYSGAIRGVPGGVDLWKAGPAQSRGNVIVPAYLGQPDNFSQFSNFAAGGGGAPPPGRLVSSPV